MRGCGKAWPVELELHQLELRYATLRRQHPGKERALLASLAELGQQTAVVVVGGGETGRYVLLDGYKRVRALARLHRDTVLASRWELAEPEALLLERLMRSSEADSPLEEGWLLRELRERFGLSCQELARRFDKTESWVSRRLALVRALPEAVQEHVRKGELVAHAAMKHLVPLARANPHDCMALAAAFAKEKLSSRDIGTLCHHWGRGNEATRELILKDPRLALRAQAESTRLKTEGPPSARLLSSLSAIAAIARRETRTLSEETAQKSLVEPDDELRLSLQAAQAESSLLFSRLQKEFDHAR